MAVVSAVEDLLPVSPQRPQPDVLSGLVVESSSLCGSNVNPPRSPVDGAGVARGLDEGFDEHGGGVGTLIPVFGQATADDGEDVGAEVGDFDP